VLAEITPVILTFNEAPNIGRNLERLGWARDVVVVDSGSTDETEAIAKGFANVRWFTRKFDTHAQQWNFAVGETGVASDWVLRLDADYILDPVLREEIAALAPAADVTAYEVAFTYCIDGRKLRGSLYPPLPILFRRGQVSIVQDGHTEKVRPAGRVERLDGRMLHDDRKSFDRWFASQKRYQAQEAAKLMSKSWRDLGWPDRIRRTRVLGAPAVAVHCLFVKGLLFDGMAGLRYTAQRVMADLLLSLQLIRRDFGRKPLA
jgi:glycosyltransferase involved in cell wall biosynthesis